MTVKNAPFLFLQWLENPKHERIAKPIASALSNVIDIVYRDVDSREKALISISEWLSGNDNAQVLFIGSHGDEKGIGDYANTGIDWPELGDFLLKHNKNIYLWLFACNSASIAKALSNRTISPPVKYIVGFPESVTAEELSPILQRLILAYDSKRIVYLDEEADFVRQIAGSTSVNFYFPVASPEGRAEYIETSEFYSKFGISYKNHLLSQANLPSDSILGEAIKNLRQ